ncbi:hypothetical protein PR202_gb06569 [Eleusine coracana subsp. coracana]|uniref:Uncharacterized protein n=1 Tax=Eleusine coracana subsp. coracana TaxID=191504 RepID=A0AAV5EAT1_ELECO|nr:hypothetical protein PR202_gb06569 [Eleusine coracana subsp. coracana]
MKREMDEARGICVSGGRFVVLGRRRRAGGGSYSAPRRSAVMTPQQMSLPGQEADVAVGKREWVGVEKQAKRRLPAAMATSW